MPKVAEMFTPKPEIVSTSTPAVVEVAPLVKFTDSETGQAVAASVLAILDRFKVRPIETDVEATRLAEQRAQLKIVLKNLEHHRKQAVEPLKKEAAAIDAKARQWRDPIQELDKEAEQALVAWIRFKADQTRREADKALELAENAAIRQGEAEKAGDSAGAEKASMELARLEAVKPSKELRGFQTDSGTTSMRERWAFEVVDMEEVPRMYLEPNMGKLQAAVDAGARDIPGLNITLSTTLSVRTR